MVISQSSNNSTDISDQSTSPLAESSGGAPHKHQWTNLQVCCVTLPATEEEEIAGSSLSRKLSCSLCADKCEITVYCSECQGMVCVDCVGYHQRTTILANHNLYFKNSQPEEGEEPARGKEEEPVRGKEEEPAKGKEEELARNCNQICCRCFLILDSIKHFYNPLTPKEHSGQFQYM